MSCPFLTEHQRHHCAENSSTSGSSCKHCLVVWTFHNSTLHLLSSLLSLCPIVGSVLAAFCWLLFSNAYPVVSVVWTFDNLSLDLSGFSYLFICNCKSLLHPCHIQLALVLQSLSCCFSCVDIFNFSLQLSGVPYLFPCRSLLHP